MQQKIKTSEFSNKVFQLIIISTLIRCIIASSSELGNVEAYYWTFAQHLQWNYFDHPPIVGWLIRLTTANLLLHNEFFTRAGAIISSAVSTWLIFRIGSKINNERTGWFAALLYTSSLYASLGAGTYILPDSPQLVFWLLSIYLLIKILHSAEHPSNVTLLWCYWGIATGLCVMCKAHGIFLWLGLVLYCLLFNRSWFKYRGIYLSALITIIVISPIIVWNLQNHFASYEFHSHRVSLSGATIHFERFIKQLLKVILITNPINFFLICMCFISSPDLPVFKKDIQLILCCSLPLILILLFVSLFRETYPHWSGPAWSTLLLIPAIRLNPDPGIKIRLVPNIMKWALAFLLIIGFSEILITNLYPGTSSEQKEGLNLGKGDLTLDMFGWKYTGEKFDSLYKQDVTNKRMPPGAPIIVTKWFPAAHIDFYVASLTKQQTVGIGNISDLHQYYWTNKYKQPLKSGDSAYYIVPSNLFDYKILDKINNCFASYEMPLVIESFRNGSICKHIYVFRLKGYKPGSYKTDPF